MRALGKLLTIEFNFWQHTLLAIRGFEYAVLNPLFYSSDIQIQHKDSSVFGLSLPKKLSDKP